MDLTDKVAIVTGAGAGDRTGDCAAIGRCRCNSRCS